MRRQHWICGLVWLAQWLAAPVAESQVERIETFPKAEWEVRTPEEVGLDGSLLASLSALVGGGGMIVKDGFWVFGWGSQTAKRDWMSAAKPVTSTLLLFAVKEGLLASEHALTGPFVEQEFAQPLLSKDSLMSFHHLAHMTSGYALPLDLGPGMHWGYNDYAIKLYNVLLANQVFGSSLNDVATHPTRLGALQFQDGTIYSSRNGLGVFTSPRDFARIGWFWLNRGYWDGLQLLPDEAFDKFLSVGVATSTPKTAGGLNDYLGVGTYGGGTNQTSAGPGVYGFNLWINSQGSLWPDAPDDTYQANGGWNRHAITVIPSLKIVAVWSNSTEDDPENFAGPMNDALKLLTESADVPFTVSSGWSRVSPPVRMADMSIASVLDDPVAVAFRFENGRYVIADSMEVGRGYLVHSRGVTKTLRGEHVLPRRIPIAKGWNLVGVYHNQVTTSEITSDPPGIIVQYVIGDPADFNSSEAALTPGVAYWVRASEDGHLVYVNEPGTSGHRPVVPTSYQKRKGPISELERSPPSNTDFAGESVVPR